MASKKNGSAVFMEFWGKHPNYTAVVHTVLGIGLGLLGQTFVKEGYTDTLGWLLVFLGVIGHLYPLVA